MEVGRAMVCFGLLVYCMPPFLFVECYFPLCVVSIRLCGPFKDN